MTARMSIGWTRAEVEQLKALWAEKHSARVIARRMGISHDAVIGKVHRLRLEGRASPIKRRSPGSAPPVVPSPLRLPFPAGHSFTWGAISAQAWPGPAVDARGVCP